MKLDASLCEFEMEKDNFTAILSASDKQIKELNSKLIKTS